VPTIDSFSCSPTSFTVVITKDPADQSVYRLRIPTWLDGGTLPTSFANSASLSYVAGEAAPVTYNVSGAVSRSASGGSGTGIIVKPPTGTPKLTITKVALAKKVRAGKNVRWKVTVRSTGTATATNVRVCDSPLDNQSFPLRTATVTVGATTRKAPLTFLNGTGCVSIASLARGASATVIFTTHIPLTGKSRARNTSLASATGVTAVRASARVTVIKVAGRTHIPSPAG
jgi:uncharacterized repeat protein (TIGR01451 family)